MACRHPYSRLASPAPPAHCRFTVLKSHMSAQLGQSHNQDTVTAVQKLVCLAIQESSLNVPHSLVRGTCVRACVRTHTANWCEVIHSLSVSL